jgi:cytochrome c oxidase subunit I+III
MVTSMLDARPQEIFRVGGPSLWPFIAALGMGTIFAAETFSLHWLALVGVVVLLGALIGWNWPERLPTPLEEEERFEQDTDIPVRPNGSPIITRWAMGASILVISIVTGTLLFSLFYLRIENTTWPPANIPLPALPMALAAFGLVAISAGFAWWADRSVRRDQRGRMKLGLALSFVFGLAAIVVQAIDLTSQPFRMDTHAYGSIFWILSGWMLLVILVGLVFNVLAQIWAWRGLLHAGHTTGVSVTSLYFTSAAILWLAVVGLSRYVSVGSIVAVLAIPLLIWAFHLEWPYLVLGVLVAALVIYKHMPNIKRLASGTEPKINRKFR